MKCVVNWIPPRIRVRSRNTEPHLKPTLAKHDAMSKKIKIRYRKLVQDAPLKIVLITSTEKVSIYCGTCRENPLNIAILPVKTPFSIKYFC